MTILSLHDITMQFGGVIAVNNLNLTINQGEIVALIGPNGAGKTTVFNVITGVYDATNGEIFFEGKRMVSNHPKGAMKRLYAGENRDKYTKTITKTPDQVTKLGIARTFQNIRLFHSMTALENVMVGMHLHRDSCLAGAMLGLSWKEEERMRRKGIELLQEVGLEKERDEAADSLPYGKQRQLEIARALATQPKLLLLDEPAAGMNPHETEELTHFLRNIKEKFDLSILLIEHHMNLVMELSQRIYVIEFGKLIAQGSPAAIQSDQKVIDAYLGVRGDE